LSQKDFTTIGGVLLIGFLVVGLVGAVGEMLKLRNNPRAEGRFIGSMEGNFARRFLG
jgi:hypothetical protein